MSKKIGLIHTSATLIPVFQELIKKHFEGQDIKVFNIVDDSLVKNIIDRGSLTTEISKRVLDYVSSANDSGADYILVTCSSIGQAVEMAASYSKVPVLRVDQPMADVAIQTGTKIGVVATLASTLEPTSDLVRRRAAIAEKEIELTSRLCEGAFDALMGGNPELHDKLVVAVLKELTQEVDVILLAQASMARVVGQLSEDDKKVPILASPEIAVQHMASLLNS